MSFGKFSIKQILEASKTFVIEVRSKDEYADVRLEALKYNPELVKQWDIQIRKYEFPHYLTTTGGDSIPKIHAIQHNYYVVSFDEIEFHLPVDLNTYICEELNKMQDHRKEQVLELVKKLAEEERADHYWYIDAEGRICPCRASQNITDTKDRKTMGNYFATKGEAEFEYHRRMAVAKWKRIHDKLERGKRKGLRFYFPCYDEEQNKIVINCSEGMRFGGLIFSSDKTCRAAVEELGETNVKEYILGVVSEADK